MFAEKSNTSGPYLSPFSTILVFTAFILIGLSLIPILDIQLSPSRSANNLSVSYSWPNASARLIEQEVTSTLEGLFSSIKGLININTVIYHINLMSLIGIIVMSGIILNDSILKIDTINQLRKNGYSLLKALHVVDRRRLKPILMTSLTTILA